MNKCFNTINTNAFTQSTVKIIMYFANTVFHLTVSNTRNRGFRVRSDRQMK